MVNTINNTSSASSISKEINNEITHDHNMLAPDTYINMFDDFDVPVTKSLWSWDNVSPNAIISKMSPAVSHYGAYSLSVPKLGQSVFFYRDEPVSLQSPNNTPKVLDLSVRYRVNYHSDRAVCTIGLMSRKSLITDSPAAQPQGLFTSYNNFPDGDTSDVGKVIMQGATKSGLSGAHPNIVYGEWYTFRAQLKTDGYKISSVMFEPNAAEDAPLTRQIFDIDVDITSQPLFPAITIIDDSDSADPEVPLKVDIDYFRVSVNRL